MQRAVIPSDSPFVLAENDDADRVTFQVQRQAVDPAGELDHLAVLGICQTVHAHDAVRDADDGAFVLRFRVHIV